MKFREIIEKRLNFLKIVEVNASGGKNKLLQRTLKYAELCQAITALPS